MVVDAGTLAGAVDTSGVLVFRGVPYAAPPVGDLRWRPPQALSSWSGVRAADRLGKNCMQGQVYSDIDPFAAGVSEDCLNLNVWTTTLDARLTGPCVRAWPPVPSRRKPIAAMTSARRPKTRTTNMRPPCWRASDDRLISGVEEVAARVAATRALGQDS